MKRISNKCKAYGCDFHYEQTGEEFRELKDEKGNKYTARFVLVEAEGTAIINDWEFIAELEHTENGNIITGVAGVEVPERYYTSKPMCEHCNSKRYRKNTYIVRNKTTGEFKQVGKSCLKDFTHGMSAEAVTQYMSLFDTLIEGETPESGCSYQRYVNTKEYLSYVAETIRHFGYTRSSDEGISTAIRALDFYDAAHGRAVTKEYLQDLLDKMRSVNFDIDSDLTVKLVSDALENGVTTIKLIGKLLREKITIEGLFTIVLRTGVNEGKYYFYTQNSGKDTVKSPMGMFPAYAIDNDLNYVADKIRNFYEVGEYKTDAEMGQADAQAASDLEKPDANGRRARGGKKTTATATPPTTTEDAAPKTGRTARKTHDEVVAENNQKMADYMAERDKAVNAVADGREEIPFDEACAAADSVPQPELETPPRRTRKERKSAEQSEPVQDGTTNTDSESVTLDADTYFYVPADDNYVMKHKGDTVDLIVDGVEVMKVISKEEFGEGVKRLAQADNPKPENPIDGAMNPPEKGRRTRRSAAQAQPDNADTTADETPAVDEQPTGRTRRVRKTR